MKSNCDICIVPLQDYLGLSDDLGRMNTPGVALGNWGYISKENDFTSDLLNYINRINSLELKYAYYLMTNYKDVQDIIFEMNTNIKDIQGLNIF